MADEHNAGNSDCRSHLELDVMTLLNEDMIEFHFEDSAQLFDVVAAFPFRERDLGREAEDYIVGWGHGFAPNRPIKTVIRFPNAEAQAKTAMEPFQAVERYLSDLAGVVVVLYKFPLRRLVEESLLILGRVASWCPLEIFLCDWWPLARRHDLYRRLSTAMVEPRLSPVPVVMAGPR